MKKCALFSLLGLISPFTTSAVAREEEGYLLTPDKIGIFYKIVRTGSETWVAVHAGPGNSLESIRADMEPLAKGRRVIYYDQRGQGRSELITDGKKLIRAARRRPRGLRQHFKLDKMALLGNSWGGLLISLYAIAHPDRGERLVLDSPAPPIKGFMDDMNDEISRRMKEVYTPQLERARITGRPELWLKTDDPVGVCREFYTLVLRTYTYARSLDGFKGDVCAGGKESVRLQRIVNHAA